jgi:hypothetical protein
VLPRSVFARTVGVTSARSVPVRARIGGAGALLAVASVVAPPASGATPAQQPPADGAGATTAPAGADGPLRADATDLSRSLRDARAGVAEQIDALRAARAAAAAAEDAADDARAAVRTTERRIADLTERTDQTVVDAFINPPVETAMETLATESVVGSTVRQSLLASGADHNAELLAELEEARAELEEEQQAQEEAAAEAEARAAAADTALADLVDAQSSETLFVMAVEDRLAASEVEAASLAEIDPEAAATLREREGEIAGLIDEVVAEREERARLEALAEAMAEADAQAEAEALAGRGSTGSDGSPGGGTGGSAPAPVPSTIGPASGGLASVPCPGGGSITVAGSIAGSLRAMLDAAAAAGNRMCGNGYRDPAEQVAVRRSNCGTSYYAIYEAPASACSPPTAPPGSSSHEQGLAVDLTCNGGGVLSTSSSCYHWMVANAAGYGFHNLPGEPWHWSTDGT